MIEQYCGHLFRAPENFKELCAGDLYGFCTNLILPLQQNFVILDASHSTMEWVIAENIKC